MFYISLETQRQLPDRVLQILCLLPKKKQIIFEITYKYFQPNKDVLMPYMILNCIIYDTDLEICLPSIFLEDAETSLLR